MTREELFKKNYPEYVTKKGECLSPYWDLFSAGIECATYELNKGCIQTLTKENAELKETLKTYNGCGDWDNDFHTCRVYLQHEELQEYIEQLTKAKALLKEWIVCHGGTREFHSALQDKTEAFLKEAEK